MRSKRIQYKKKIKTKDLNGKKATNKKNWMKKIKLR
jgi:hypothetical protein